MHVFLIGKMDVCACGIKNELERGIADEEATSAGKPDVTMGRRGLLTSHSFPFGRGDDDTVNVQWATLQLETCFMWWLLYTVFHSCPTFSQCFGGKRSSWWAITQEIC